MDRTRPDDEELISRVGNGDAHALEALYDRYARPVFSLASRITGDQQAAEEITQEVFVRVWQQATTYSRERGRLSSWLLGIAHHLSIDEIRRRGARPQSSHSSDDPSQPRSEPRDSSPDPGEIAIGQERREAVLLALSSLPAEQRQVIELSYFAGLTQAEIAEKLVLPLGTVKTRTRLGLQRLRAELLARGMLSDTL